MIMVKPSDQLPPRTKTKKSFSWYDGNEGAVYETIEIGFGFEPVEQWDSKL